MKRLTKSKMKPNEVIYERFGYFFMNPPGKAYELIRPSGMSDLLSFIPDCKETDDREKNCPVFVMQKWFVKDLETMIVKTKVINAYLSKWETAWKRYKHIVSKEYIDESEIENLCT